MIIWFGGNGNSRMVAQLLASRLGEDTPVRITDLVGKTVSVSGRVIWVMPVYSWGVPPIVRRFMREVAFDGDAVHHLVLTCGDDCGLAADMWRSDAHKRGWRTGTASSVTMPNTYVFLPGFDVDTPEVTRRKLAQAPDAADRVAAAITSGSDPWDDGVTKGAMPWLKTRIVYPFFVRFMMSPRKFGVDRKACNRCGTCAAVCPVRNIKLNPYPEWGDNCAFCLACYNRCPRHAVQYGSVTRGKGQYRGPAANN